MAYTTPTVEVHLNYTPAGQERAEWKFIDYHFDNVPACIKFVQANLHAIIGPATLNDVSFRLRVPEPATEVLMLEGVVS